VMMAARAAGQLGDREAIPRLRQLLQSSFALNRQNAALSLGLLGKTGDTNPRLVSPVFPILRTMLSHRDENLRAAAAEALGRLRDRESLPLLKRMADDDPFPWVRERAATSLRAAARPRKTRLEKPGT